MDFIISSTSPKMVDLSYFMWDFKEVDRETFMKHTKNAISHVGHMDIAENIECAFNNNPVHARPGDTLWYANKEKGHMTYYKIDVLKSLREHIREEYGEI